MSDHPTHYQVFNNRSQPVELHCGRQVVVIPPHGQTELDGSILAAPQVLKLCEIGAITIQEKEVGSPGPAQAEVQTGPTRSTVRQRAEPKPVSGESATD